MKATVLVDYAKEALANGWGYIWGTSGELWTADKQKALEKTTDQDRAMGRKYGSQWIGHYVTDCSGLIYRPCKQRGVAMPHGSHTMYTSYCSAKGKLVSGKRADGKQLRPGTAVFTYNSQTGRYGHVGVYIGDGLVIEAMGTRNGVTTSKITRWGFWGELKGLDYGDGQGQQDQQGADQGQQDPTERPTLRKGQRGENVTLMQTKLQNLGYSLGSSGVDGIYGSRTEIAVKQFQRDWGLVEDGVCGPATWQVLEGAVSNKLYTVTIRHLIQSTAKQLAAGYLDATITEEE